VRDVEPRTARWVNKVQWDGGRDGGREGFLEQKQMRRYGNDAAPLSRGDGCRGRPLGRNAPTCLPRRVALAARRGWIRFSAGSFDGRKRNESGFSPDAMAPGRYLYR
jgi:hypothetical protein